MHHRLSHRVAAALLLGLVSSARADEPPGAKKPTPPYQRGAVLYEGMASIPWYATYSGDGRVIAVVEGHPRHMLKILDAATRKVLADIKPEGQPASHRPALNKDGTRLILIEGSALVVRRKAAKWAATERIPLGFDPGITRRARSLELSPDGKSVAFVNDGAAYVVELAKKHLRRIDGAGYFAVHYLSRHLALTQWDAKHARTLYIDFAGKHSKPLPAALLAISSGADAQLVARKPSADDEYSLSVLDTISGTIRFELDLEDRLLTAAGFSPDGKHFVTVERGKVAVIHDAFTGDVLQRISEYEDDRMIGFVFSPDGKTLVTSGRRPKPNLSSSVLTWSRSIR